ncbi:hypothetical protein Ddye_014690 [Dipteronia dyeriana]|uniref:Disease resistance N-terminal domain-containing protein n=1 Tax=Dipteronia dyeriana TaxID=168575 RepID=A0AAE0CKU6_9ROSI|nr:hypothetical protein Ddye_014690 [Dipteronia dyeriana]
MAVGELLLSAFLQVLFERLMSPELLNFARQERVRSKLKKLEKMLKLIEAMLSDAEEKQLTNRAFKMWLGDLQHLATEALERNFKAEHQVGVWSKAGIYGTVVMS